MIGVKVRVRHQRRRKKCIHFNAIGKIGGGEKGIRTLETVPRLHTFQACAFDHSAISPHAGGPGPEGLRCLQAVMAGAVGPLSQAGAIYPSARPPQGHN